MYETWCNQSCPTEVWQTHVVLQASFRPLCVVTWVSLIECCDSHEESIDCRLVETDDNNQCYCYYEIECDKITDDWVEYDICVKDRVIYLQASYSEEMAWEAPCNPDGKPGGQALGGSKIATCSGRKMDCVGVFAECVAEDSCES
jgi:hypothetical protein